MPPAYFPRICGSIICSALIVAATSLHAAPEVISYQARLTDSHGAPLAGTHTMYFSIYQGGDAATAGTGTLQFSESSSVALTDGIAFCSIGSGANLFGGPLKPAMFSSSLPMYLEVSVDAPGG